MPAKKYKMVERKVSDLIPYVNNSRVHSDEQVIQICSSIKEFGFTNPVLIDEDNGVIAGHGRILAAKKLDLKSVPCVVLAGLSEAKKKAYVIADNKLQELGGWDDTLLAAELQALDELDFDLSLIGFNDEELEGLLLVDDDTDYTEEDTVPEPEQIAISKPGDLWILGKHKVLCGNSTAETDVKTLMGDELADMVFTDPPYNVDYESPNSTLKNKKIKNDKLGSGFAEFLAAVITHLFSYSKGAIYICMSSSELCTLQNAFREAGGKWSTFIIWAKNHFAMGRSDYHRQYEPILYGWKDGVDHYWCGDRTQSDLWPFNKPHRNDLHPTMKPVELVEKAVRNSSKTKDIVLDLFGGSGSTLIACEKANRQARLMELDPIFVDVIIRRWEQYTGQEAVHESSGQTFEQVKSKAEAA